MQFQKPFQTLLSRSKRDSESSENIIQQENTALQKRLHSQEDDFQRQNVLLMQELQLLAGQNEELQRKLKSPVHQQNSFDAGKRDELEAKILALEAELSAFRKLSSPTSGNSRGDDGSVDQNRSAISDGERLTVELSAATEEIRGLKNLLESNRVIFL